MELPVDSINEILVHIDSLYDVLSLMSVSRHFNSLRDQVVIHSLVDTRNQPKKWFFDRALNVIGTRDYPMAKKLVLTGLVTTPLHEGLIDLTLDCGPTLGKEVSHIFPKSLRVLHYNVPIILRGKKLPPLERLIIGRKYPINCPIRHFPPTITTLAGPSRAFTFIPPSVKRWVVSIYNRHDASCHNKIIMPTDPLDHITVNYEPPFETRIINIHPAKSITLMVSRHFFLYREYIKFPNGAAIIKIIHTK